MTFVIWILTAALVVNCAILILLVLVQLPKKEAGAGIAFGGGAADALFGAGSGNALTNVTKWAIVVFLLLIVTLGMLNARVKHASNQLNVITEPAKVVVPSTPAPAPASVPATAPAAGSNALLTLPTSVPAATTNH